MESSIEGKKVMYLRKDVIGEASRIEYGKTGDKVTVIDDHEREMILVEGAKERFHVRAEALSDQLIQSERSIPVKIVTRKKKGK